MINVNRSAALLIVLLALAWSAGVAFMPDDPQSQVLEARALLQRGDVDGSEAAVKAVRILLESDPYWDPDGSLARHLLPELEIRIARMRTAIDELDALPELIRKKHSETRGSDETSDLATFFEWRIALVEWVRAEMDRILGTIPAGPERGALLQSESYARVTTLVEAEIVPEFTDALEERVTDLIEVDERIRILKSRLESLKREIISSSVERERLQGELTAAHDKHRAYQRRLIEFIGYDPTVPGQSKSDSLHELGLALAERIRDRFNEVRSLKQMTLLEKALYLEEIERFRLANAANVSDGSRDLSGRIKALAATIESVRVTENDVFDPSMGWFACCMSACRR